VWDDRPVTGTRLVWLLIAAVATEIWITYARLPAIELYHVSGTGFWAGASRALVFLNFPVALIAIALVLVQYERLGSPALRTLALGSIALCAVVVWPGVVRQSNLDPRAINAVPAAGVALALLLSLLAAAGPRPSRGRGDTVRIVVAAALVVLALPWLAAELGFYLDVPLLRSIFHTAPLLHRQPGLPPFPPVVHHGHHHGMDGLLLVVSSLLLSRHLQLLRRGLPRLLLRIWLSLMLAYGLAQIANDFWLEQVVKRGWTSWQIPNVLEPSLSWGWDVIVVGAAAAALTVYRPASSSGMSCA
jgi:hypothetical protein